MINSNSLSDEQLKEYADFHIMYEVDMMLWSAAFLLGLIRTQKENQLSKNIKNSILNAYSIHVRNIINFLYPKKIQATDITIHDYVSKEDIEKHLIPQSDLLKNALIKTHKQVAHLTTDRISYEGTKEKGWEFLKITGDIAKSLNSIYPYISHSKSEYLKQKLSSGIIHFPNIEVIGEATSIGEQVCFEINYIGPRD